MNHSVDLKASKREIIGVIVAALVGTFSGAFLGSTYAAGSQAKAIQGLEDRTTTLETRVGTLVTADGNQVDRISRMEGEHQSIVVAVKDVTLRQNEVMRALGRIEGKLNMALQDK